jgi:GTP-binding protein
MDFRYKKHYEAENGQDGMRRKRSGKRGEDRIVMVPPGTLILDEKTGALMKDLVLPGEKLLAAKGGRGGKGNINYVTSVRQAPNFAEAGGFAAERAVILELKLIADVGLVGFPNAGKSTLLSVISAAKPEIADYPFTTLTPNLGMVQYRNNRSFVVADIPGIIEGAHQGKGLGIRFLRHIERNSMLLFIIPADSKNIGEEYRVLLNELKEYNPELLDKKRLIAISKCDMLDGELIGEMKAELDGLPQHIFISAVAQTGLTELKDKIWKILNDN